MLSFATWGKAGILCADMSKTLLAMTDRQTNVLVSIFSDVCRKLIFSEIENVNEVKKVGERKKEPKRLLLSLESKEASPTKRATKKLA